MHQAIRAWEIDSTRSSVGNFSHSVFQTGESEAHSPLENRTIQYNRMNSVGNSVIRDADGRDQSRLFVLAAVDQSSGQALRVLTDEEIAHLKYVMQDFNPHGCFNCGIEKTPQWRKGPMTKWGHVKLCNACGTKYLRSMRRQGTSSRIVPSPSDDQSKVLHESVLA